MLSGLKKIWRWRNHDYFPPHFRASVRMIQLIGNRLGEIKQVEFPWQRICKYLPRNWFDSPDILERQKQLQPHLFIDRYKLEMQRKGTNGKYETNQGASVRILISFIMTLTLNVV